MAERLTLIRGNWYGWQMLPGYSGSPYFSPIRIDRCTALKTGQSILEVEYLNIGYAAGVQSFEEELRVIVRQPDYMIAIRGNEKTGSNVRSVIITHLDWTWLRRHCLELLDENSTIDEEKKYLNANDFLDRRFNI